MTKSITPQTDISTTFYLKELSKDKRYKSLTKQEEQVLFMQYRLSGDKEIKERILASNYRWVISVAKKYNFNNDSFVDLINEGNIGLIIAFDNFDYSKGFRFITYATPYIIREIKNFINITSTDMTLSSNYKVIDKYIKIVKQELIKEDKILSDITIIEKFNQIKPDNIKLLTTQKYAQHIVNTSGFISSDVVIYDNTSITLSDTFECLDDEFNPTINLIQKETNIELLQKLDYLLSKNEFDVIVKTHALDGSFDEMTREQIASDMNMTRERIGQIYIKAITKLKQHKELLKKLF